MDYTQLKYDGNGYKQNTFSLVFQAAADLLGKKADYETLYCLSGNAFAPVVDTGENCAAWWYVKGRQQDKEIKSVVAYLPEFKAHFIHYIASC